MADGSFYLQKGCLFPSLEKLLTYYKANWKLIQNPVCPRWVLCVSGGPDPALLLPGFAGPHILPEGI